MIVSNKRRHVGAHRIRRKARDAAQRRGVHDREIELALAGAEAVEQVEGAVHDPFRPGLGPVDLVDDDDRREAVREGFLRDEARLRHRAVHGVHEQQHAVHHRQHALHFAAEVRVPGRVHDVDAVVAPLDRGVLREDRDAALFLERVRVHHALGDGLADVERARLAQQLVHERGLAVVDVRDDRDVSQVLDHVDLEKGRVPFLKVAHCNPKGGLNLRQNDDVTD